MSFFNPDAVAYIVSSDNGQQCKSDSIDGPDGLSRARALFEALKADPEIVSAQITRSDDSELIETWTRE